MNNFMSPKVTSLIVVGLLSFSVNAQADGELPTLKPVGISLDAYRQSLDLDVTNIKTKHPAISAEMLNTIKPQLNTTNQIEMYGLRLDYQLTPSFNVFGLLGKVKEKTTVSFSDANPMFSDLTLNNKGVSYTAGAVYAKQFDPMFVSLTALHTLIDLDDNPHDITVSSIVPSVGVITRVGAFTGSLVYQDVDAVFDGDITVPMVGDVPVEVSASNGGEVQLVLGLRTRLARDLYLNANAGVTGQEHYQLQLNKRF